MLCRKPQKARSRVQGKGRHKKIERHDKNIRITRMQQNRPTPTELAIPGQKIIPAGIGPDIIPRRSRNGATLWLSCRRTRMGLTRTMSRDPTALQTIKGGVH